MLPLSPAKNSAPIDESALPSANKPLAVNVQLGLDNTARWARLIKDRNTKLD